MYPYPQDLHIHTTFSRDDGAVVPQQTVELVAAVGHARTAGISDHLESILDVFPVYEAAVHAAGLLVGTEVNGADWTRQAEAVDARYYLYHCRDRHEDYRGAERLLATGKPVIIAHPLVLETDLRKVPPECLVEINNRYIWRSNWNELRAFTGTFRFVIDSDAHQPHWLNQNVARYVARELGIRETLLFAREAGPEMSPAPTLDTTLYSVETNGAS
jgi:histidinol phosphatase-like PHP family hydrolase